MAEMDPVIASMRGQLPDGMCDGTGPTTGRTYSYQMYVIKK